MSAKAKQTVLSKAAEVGIRKLQYDVFGTLPQLNVKTGFKAMKKMHKGVFAARYYPEPIEKSARLATPGYKSAKELRRVEKLEQLRRRGKGPPKKGSGRRSKK